MSLGSWLFTPGPGSYSLPVVGLLYSTSDPAWVTSRLPSRWWQCDTHSHNYATTHASLTSLTAGLTNRGEFPTLSVAALMNFAHKGLRALFEQHDARRLNVNHVARIERILSDLDAAESAHDMDLPGYRLHALKGVQRGLWSARVSGNWRIVFRFVAGEAVDVDLIDYH